MLRTNPPDQQRVVNGSVAASREQGDLMSFLSSSLPASKEVSAVMKL